MLRWPWPTPLALVSPSSSGWDPNNPCDRDHVMPIITPCVPQINSAVNIDSATLLMIKEGLEDGRDACRAVLDGIKTWDQLLLPSKFFTEYAHYLEVTAWAQSDVMTWFGAVESRLRRLCQMLRNCPAISQVRIWPTPFPTLQILRGFRRQDWYIGLRFQNLGEETLETLRGPLHIFKDTCDDSARQILPTWSTAFDLTWRLLEKRQLPSEVVPDHDHDTYSTMKLATHLNHLQFSQVEPTPANPRVKGRFKYYYPNSAHWLSQCDRELPIASSTPPLSPVGRCRSLSINIPMEKNSVAQLESFSFPSATNLPRRPPCISFPIKVPPPSLCDTSVPPPNQSLESSHNVAPNTIKSR